MLTNRVWHNIKLEGEGLFPRQLLLVALKSVLHDAEADNRATDYIHSIQCGWSRLVCTRASNASDGQRTSLRLHTNAGTALRQFPRVAVCMQVARSRNKELYMSFRSEESQLPIQACRVPLGLGRFSHDLLRCTYLRRLTRSKVAIAYFSRFQWALEVFRDPQAKMSPAKVTGKCPFDHGQRTGNATSSSEIARPVNDTEPNAHATPSTQASPKEGCPYPHSATAAAPQTSAVPATCPMGYGPQPSSAEAPQTAQCPMGFSSADGPRMTELHCVICKSLLYDCVQLSCSCKYCRHCVAAYNDCPLCGADITSRKPASELQGV